MVVRIFFLAPNQIERPNWGWQLLRNEIARQHDVTFYGEGHPNHNGLYIPDVLTDYEPFDAMMLGDAKYISDYQGIGKVNLPKIFFIGDYYGYHPHNENYYLERNDIFMVSSGVDIVVTKSPAEHRTFLYSQEANPAFSKMESIIMSYSVDTNIYKNLGLKKVYDVAALFNHFAGWCYPQRVPIKEMIMRMDGIKWICGDRKRGPIRHDYVKAINMSKIFIGNGNIFGNTSWKTTEALACGTFLLTTEASDGKMLGFEDGKHLVCYKTVPELKEKIRYYLGNTGEREKIAKQGMEFVRENHSNEVRIKQLTEYLEKKLWS
jgi:hypothetical protein